MIINRIKLAKALLKLAEIKTENGTLIYEGDLLVGTEVFIESEGEVIAAPDGEYVFEGKIYIVADGKLVEIKEVEEPKEDEPVEPVEPIAAADEPKEDEPKEDDKDLKIKELEGLLQDRDATIEELTNKIKELEEELNKKEEELKMSAANPIKEKLGKVDEHTNKEMDIEIKALKYFK